MTIRLLLALFLGMALTLSGCATPVSRGAVAEPGIAVGPGGAQPGQTEQVVSMATQTPTPTAATAAPAVTATPAASSGQVEPLNMPPAIEGLISTYRNPKVGFTLDYPSDWQLEDINPALMDKGAYTVTIISPIVRKPGKQSEGLPPGASKIDLTVEVSETPVTLDQAVEKWRQNVVNGEFPAKIVSEKKGALASGIEGVRWEVVSSTGSDPVSMFITVVNGQAINVIGMGDLALVDTIVSSLRLGK